MESGGDKVKTLLVALTAALAGFWGWQVHPLAAGNFDDVLQAEALRNGSQLMRLERTMWADVDQQRYDVVYFEVPTTKRVQVLARLRQVSAGERQIFYCNMSFRNSPERICILKSRDPYDILRLMGTDGANYDLGNDEIVKRIQEWDARYGIVIDGADGDWVDIKFKTLPSDMRKFAEEVYTFCPDSVEQNAGSLDALSHEMALYRGVILWWD